MKKKNSGLLKSGRSAANDFFADVYEVVKLIPKGRVTSYGAIAAYLGTKKSARMVGWALNGLIKTNGDVPAHRVVNRNGMLTGKMHFGDGDEMARRLRAEGIDVENDAVVHFHKLCWNPIDELGF